MTRRNGLLLLLLACLAQCGAETAIPASETQDAVGESTAAEPVRRMAMSGMDFYLHDYSPTHGTARKPTFWVHAEEGALDEERKIWVLKQTRAVIYGEAGSQVTLEAEYGHFDETNETAQLRGGVIVIAGAITMELSEIEWDNEEGVARSGEPLMLADGETQLRAESLVLDPNKRTFKLTGVKGRLMFREENS